MKKIYLIIPLFLLGCGKTVEIATTALTPANPGPTHVQINKDLPENGDVTDKFVVVKNSQGKEKIVYISDETTEGIDELMVSDIDGKNRKKISLPLDMNENVTKFKVSPDGDKVAYIADATDGFFNLYTVNLDGSNQNQVNVGVNTVNNKVAHFQWTPSSEKLVYTCDENKTVGEFSLFIANYDGTGRLTLNNGQVGEIFDISPNGARIVYREGLVNPNLRSITPAGTGDILLNTPFNLVTKPASGVSNFVISPNSYYVAYRTNQDDNQKFDLYVTNIEGTGSRIRVNSMLVTGGNVGLTPKEEYNFTEDSSKIVYIADQNEDNKDELFVATLTPSLIKLNPSLVAGGDVKRFKISGSKILFLADAEINGVNELYSSNLDGTNLVKVNSDLVAGENVGYFSTDSSKISYLMDLGHSGKYSVYLTDFTGSNEQELISLGNDGLGAYDPSYSFSEQLKMIDSKVYFRASINNNINNLYYFNINSGELKLINELSGNVLLSDSNLGTSFIITNSSYAVYRKQLSSGKNLFSSKLP